MKNKPLVLVPACNKMLGQHPFHIAGKKYVDAVRLAGCLPVIVPTMAEGEIDEWLDHAEGVFLTGSPSNVHPSHFGEDVHDPQLPLDPDRDAWTLPLIRRVLERGIPLFAICRGFQETNVALGGSLHQAVHEQPGQRDHRGARDQPVEVVYGLAHEVTVEAGGLLDGLLGNRSFEVNSLHGQGVNRLADGLRVEARAPDGLVEAFSKPDTPAFNLCVQWHPEWQAETNEISMRMLGSFGEACRAYRDSHAGSHRGSHQGDSSVR